MRILGAALALLVVAQPLAAQQHPIDSTRNRLPPKRVIRLWQAGALAGLTAGAMLIDQSVRNNLHRDSGSSRSKVVAFGNAIGTPLYVGPVLVVGVLAGKAFGSKRLFGVSWRALETTVLASASALVLKSSIGRRRPNVYPDDPFRFSPFSFKDNSFPSGHTVIAFSLATSFAAETRDHWSDALFFGAASLTAFSRINDDKHWLSDTVFGAAIGIVAGRLIQHWHHPILLIPGAVGLSLTF